MVVGFIWASGQYHSLDSEIVKNFRVDLFLAAIGAFADSIVYSIVGLIVGSAIIGSIVGSAIIGSIVGSAISALGSQLSFFLFLPFSIVDVRSAVAGTMIYMPLISFTARVEEDGEVMEHFPFRNIVICPPTSNWLIDQRDSRNVGVSRASI